MKKIMSFIAFGIISLFCFASCEIMEALADASTSSSSSYSSGSSYSYSSSSVDDSSSNWHVDVYARYNYRTNTGSVATKDFAYYVEYDGRESEYSVKTKASSYSVATTFAVIDWTDVPDSDSTQPYGITVTSVSARRK